MATVTNTIKLPGGATPASSAVEIELVASTDGRAAGWVAATDVTILATYRPTVTDGAWTADLTPNADIDPSGTVYRINEYANGKRYTHYIEVGSGGGAVHDLLTSGPDGLMFDSVTNHAAEVNAHGMVSAHVDDFASPQAAIDSLNGARGFVDFGVGTYTITGSLDAKRAHLRGVGGSGNSGGGGTILSFSGTGGIYSSLVDNYGFRLQWLDIVGSAGTFPASDNGQILVDLTGQNNPRVYNCRIRQGGTGIKLAANPSPAIECHYGVFIVDISDCYVGINVTGSAGGANGHLFQGGRITACRTGALIGEDQDHIVFDGVSFECGSGATAVDSTGTNINFDACRWETIGNDLVVRSGAGPHFVNGGIFSSGIDITDENMPSVVWGLANTSESPPQVGAAPHNLVSNGSFERDSNADGLADGWSESYTSIGSGYAASLDSGEAQFGSYCQKIVTGSRSNARIYQQLRCTPGVNHVLKARYKVDAGTTQIRIGTAESGVEYMNSLMTADNAWRELRISFTPQVSTIYVTVFAVGTTSRTMYLDGVSINEGIAALPGFQQRAIPESGGAMIGALGVARYATAARPSASSAGQGAMVYDTDLGKPIWSNGSAWKDAAGTTV